MVERRRRSGGRSPLLVAMGLSLLAVPGFALGLVAGIAWEDPGLLAIHLFGGTEEVSWGGSQRETVAAAAPAAPEQPVAEALPAVAAPPEPALSATRLRPEVLAPGASASPAASAGHFSVQVGAFSESAAAERLAASLRGKGFEVYVSPGSDSTRARWRVRVGPHATREQAERTAARLKAEQKLPTWVLDEEAV